MTGTAGIDAALRDEEAAAGAGFDDPARDEPVVRIHHGERARADELRELADRGNARAVRQLAVPDQLRDALDDLVDERHSGLAREARTSLLASCGLAGLHHHDDAGGGKRKRHRDVECQPAPRVA